MKLDPAFMRKADDGLREALQTLNEDAPVRVVMILGSSDHAGDKTDTRSEARPSNFSSSAEYRHELIQRRKRDLKECIGDTLEALRQLSIQVTGGEIGRAIVAEASVKHIIEALKLPGITNAMLDRPINLVAPRRREDK